MSKFRTAIIAEFATQHLMHEKNLSGPVEMFLRLGYDLQIYDGPKWSQIEKTYIAEIDKCIKAGMGDRKSFKFKKLLQ